MIDDAPVPRLPDPVKRLLVIRQSALGDIVNALHALATIRRSAPGARIGWVVDDRFRDVFDAVEGVDDVIVYPRRRWGRFVARPWRWPQLALEWTRYRRDLRARGFEVVIDLQGNTKSGMSRRATRAPVAICFDRRVHPGGDGDPGDDRRLRSDQFLSVLQQAGMKPVHEPFPWRVPEESVRRVDAFLKPLGLEGRPFAVLHPGSSAFGAYKRWPADRFGMLADRLAASGIPGIVVWGPGEQAMARSLVEQSAGSTGGAGVHLAIETTPLSVLVALLRRAAVFIGNDSGPLHVASACGTPTVGLYGPKDPGIYAPYMAPRAILYHPLPCSPCGRRRCDNPECMKALSVDAVFDRTMSMLRERTDRPFIGVPLRCRHQQSGVPVDAPPPGTGPTRSFTAGQWQWCVVATEAGPLARAARLSTDGLPGHLFRENPRRRYLHLRLEGDPDGGTTEPTRGRDAFVKVYPVRGVTQHLRQWVGLPQAAVEFRRLAGLRNAGAPVPEPIAWGRGPSCEALVLEDVGDVPTVKDRLSSGMEETSRRRLLRNVAHAVADLHAAGVVHEDLHAGTNLELTDGSVRIVDVQRGRMTSTVYLQDRAITLAHVCLSIHAFTGVKERCRMLRQYAERAGLVGPERRALLEGVNLALGSLRLRHVLRQVQRAKRGGSRIWIGSWQNGQARASGGARDWMDAPESEIAIVKDEAGRRVIKIRKAGRVLAVKEVERRKRGRYAWEGAHGWLAAGLPTPRPFILVEPVSGPVRFISEWMEGAEPAPAWVESCLAKGAPPAWRRSVSWQLGRFVRRIHDYGVYHADLKAGNLLALEGGEGRIAWSVLDLDRVDFHKGPVPVRKALYNLAQLNAAFAGLVTRTDRLRAFLAYAARDRDLRRGWKAVVRFVMAQTKKRHHRWPR
jgi:heptosyltransferase-1